MNDERAKSRILLSTARAAYVAAGISRRRVPRHVARRNELIYTVLIVIGTLCSVKSVFLPDLWTPADTQKSADVRRLPPAPSPSPSAKPDIEVRPASPGATIALRLVERPLP